MNTSIYIKMKRKRGPKKQKVHLIFDEKERNDYLTGFQKRNLEMKVKKKEKLDNMMKAEKKKIKQSQKEAFYTAMATQRQVPEIQHLLEPTTYDLPDHTVTITQVKDLTSIDASTSMEMDGTLPSTLQAIADTGKSQDDVEKLKKLIKDLKTKRIKTLKKSKTQYELKRQQKKDDRQKAKRMRQLFQKGLRRTKKKNQRKHAKK